MYSLTGKGWGYSLIERDFKRIFVNSYIKYHYLLFIFSEQEYKYILLKQLKMTQYFDICIVLEHKATYLIKYKHITYVDYL